MVIYSSGPSVTGGTMCKAIIISPVFVGLIYKAPAAQLLLAVSVESNFMLCTIWY